MAKTETNIRLDYWKFFPAKILLSEKIQAMADAGGATPIGAYMLLICRAMEEPLPGVLMLDEAKLTRWGKLKHKQWEQYRGCILAPFEFHPPTGTLHLPMVKSLYMEQWSNLERSRGLGRAGAAKRYGKDSQKPQYSPTIGGPYIAYPAPFLPISDQNLAHVLETARKVLISLAMNGEALGGLKGANSKQQHLSSSTQQSGEVPATLEAGDGTAANISQDSPQPPSPSPMEIYRIGRQRAAGGAA